jgi:hypothetical protein
MSPSGSKPASDERFKTGHSEVKDSYHFCWFNQVVLAAERVFDAVPVFGRTGVVRLRWRCRFPQCHCKPDFLVDRARQRLPERGAADGCRLPSWSRHSISGVAEGVLIPKTLAKILNCLSSGAPVPSSHDCIKAVAIPIFAAKWQGVMFFSIRLT